MLKKVFKFIKNFILSGVLLYAYDSFNVFSSGIIPINMLTLFIVTIFGIPGLLCLIFFSFII